MDLGRIVHPRSIAVAGASPDPATLGGAVLRNIRASGFAGDLHLVSPTRDEIDGVACLKSLRDLPIGVDAVVLNVPRAAVRDAVAACIERKAGGAVVFAAGFGEAGEDGMREQDEIAALCREAGFALLGPNCLGLANYADGVALTFEALEFEAVTGTRRVAVAAQSGAMAANIRAALQGRGVPVSHVVATGNEAVVRIDHVIRFAIAEGVAAIAAYVEQVRDPQAFLAAAREAREAGVPIVMVHPGSSAAGRAAAQSHTGAMVGDHAVMATIVRGEAVTLVDTLDELFDAAAVLYRYPRPVSGGAGVITNSGAVRGLGLDFCETIGLDVAQLEDPTLEALRGTVPPHIEVDNPFDVGTAGYSDSTVFGAATEAMLADPGVGSVLLALAGGGPRQQRGKGEAIVPVARAAGKPVALAILGDDSPLDPGLIAAMRDSETPFFRSPERALRALAAVHVRADALGHIGRRPAPADVPELAGHGALPEYRGKAFLRELGIPVPEGGLVRELGGAIEIAASVGYPVVLKAQAATLAHKSDAGGVILDLRDGNALRGGWARLMLAMDRAGVQPDGVLVETMAKPGLELVVGGRNDPQWGPVLAFGLGGVWIEALDAVELLPANACRAEILQRLARMKGAKLLGAFRGRPARDVAALSDAILRLGAALVAHPHLAEADINPLTVFAEGEGVLALDALLVTNKE